MNQQTDTLVIGAGLAGLVTAYELLKKGQRVCIVDAQPREKMGGLAKIAFGGMAIVGTPEQKKKGVKDSPELALKDWYSFAEFSDDDIYPKAWAKHYVEHSLEDVYYYMKALDVSFLPAVNWVERGLFIPGNSVPRYHIIWGCSARLVSQLLAQILPFESDKLQLVFNSTVEELTRENRKITGCKGASQQGKAFEIKAENTVVACGGFTGNIERVKQNWPTDWGKAPEVILNGSHPGNNGVLHDEVARQGGQLTHMQDMWNYAAGIPHPEPEYEGQGLSLIPCKSALWLDHKGRRIGPQPLVTGFDTNYLCQQLSQQEKPYSWQLLNKRIALKEFAISGSEHNPMIRDRRLSGLLKELVFGNHRLFEQMSDKSAEFVVADNLSQLHEKMNSLTADNAVNLDVLTRTINDFDAMVARGKHQWNDDQIRRILHARQWGSDKLRTCYPKPILDGSPLVAIKVNIISRKSLGGIQTNLHSQVLDNANNPLAGLYAVGEAAGFGGGGASGKRSLEGTFLSGCLLTAQQAAKALT
ncbi:MAG TPA: FAD-dependent oxidoreductase [Aeromonadales bacterium]|nr:FAD-dependent oxidoreductase [Aeromonadales bacterium]